MSLSYNASPFQPTNPYPNQVTTELNLANQNFTTLASAFVNNDPTTLTVVNSLTAINSLTAVNSLSVGGYTVSATPQPNTLLPLNSNAVFYNALSTTTLYNNFSLTLANSTSYNLITVSISTPSQPLVNNYKVVFRLTAGGHSSASGDNNFFMSVATASQTQNLAFWWWWTNGTPGVGFTDVAIFDQPPNTIVSYTILCGQAGGSVNFVLTNLTTQYAVFPG